MESKSAFTRKIRIKNFSLPILILGLAIQQHYGPHRAWEILLWAFGGALLLGIVWNIALWRGVSFEREMRQGWAQVGDRFSEQFTVSNKSRFPALAVTLIDHSNFPGYQSSVAWPVPQKFDKLWYMDSICTKRGLYTVGPTEIRFGDPFGLIEITLTAKETKDILVTPPIVPLREISFAKGEWQGSGGSQSKIFERTVTAAGVRGYVPGDSLFSIHWLTSARRDDLFVRTFDQHPSSDWWIFLDMDRTVQAGRGLDATEEYAAILAASIADHGLRGNQAVGLVSADYKQTWLPPKTGSGQRSEIMHALALLGLGDQPLKSLLASGQRSLGRKSHAIIITPSVNPSWLQNLSALKHRGVSATVLLLDPEDFDDEPRPHTPVTRQLAAWSIPYYLITKNIYTGPKIQDMFPDKFRTIPTMATPIGREFS